jgi:hypothetical protein
MVTQDTVTKTVRKRKYKTVQIEIGLSEYDGNKKAVRTDGLLANYQN